MKSTTKGELHRVPSTNKLDPKLVLQDFEDVVQDSRTWLSAAQDAERAHRAEWDGQTDDCKKHDANYGHLVAPWDNSWDTRSRIVKSSVDELVMLQMTAFFMAQPQPVQMEANDAASSSKVQTLLKYEVRQRLRRKLWQEMNLLTNWYTGFGHAVVRVGWEKRFTSTEVKITPELIANMLPPPEQPEGGDILGAVEADGRLESVISWMESGNTNAIQEVLAKMWPKMSKKRLDRAVGKLLAGRKSEKTDISVRVPLARPGRPLVKAYFPGVDIFYAWWLDDICRSDAVHCVESLTETELRQMDTVDGWDTDFIEAMLAQGPTLAVDGAASARIGQVQQAALKRFSTATASSLQKRIDDDRSSYQVIRSFIKAVDEDGFECCFEVISHPSVSGDGLVAVNRVVDYYMEDGCFVQFRREFDTRPNWDSAGVMALAAPTQVVVKAMRDGMLNRADLATNPPVRTAMKGPGTARRLGIAPGHLVEEDFRSKGVLTDFMKAPGFDEGALESLNYLAREHANLLGLSHPEISEGKLHNHQQFIVNNFLVSAREVMLKILSVDQQFMDPIMVSRVIGNGSMPFRVSREEIAGQYDLVLEFDVSMLDMEYVKTIWGVIREAYANDKSGVMNDEVITRWLLSTINANLADAAIGDAKEVSAEEYEHEMEQLALASTKQVIPPRRIKDPRSRIQAITDTMNNNPVLSQLYQSDEAYKAIVDSRFQAYQFNIQQPKNAEIGRSGYKPPELENEAQ